MKKWLKIILVLAVIGIIAALLVYKFVINKPHPDYATMKPEATINAAELYKQYKENKVLADSLFTGKLIEVSEILAKTEETDTTVIAVFVFSQGDFGDEGLRCVFLPSFKEKAKQLKTGNKVKIKGFCTGYNDTDVVLEQCSLVE
jgi:hypothetical protein